MRWDANDWRAPAKRRRDNRRACVRMTRESIRLGALATIMERIAAGLEGVPRNERRRARVDRARDALARLERDDDRT